MRVNWAYDPTIAEHIREAPQKHWEAPDAGPLRPRKATGRRTLGFERQRCHDLVFVPDWFLPVLEKEQEDLREAWDRLYGDDED